MKKTTFWICWLFLKVLPISLISYWLVRAVAVLWMAVGYSLGAEPAEPTVLLFVKIAAWVVMLIAAAALAFWLLKAVAAPFVRENSTPERIGRKGTVVLCGAAGLAVLLTLIVSLFTNPYPEKSSMTYLLCCFVAFCFLFVTQIKQDKKGIFSWIAAAGFSVIVALAEGGFFASTPIWPRLTPTFLQALLYGVAAFFVVYDGFYINKNAQ